MWHVCPPSTLCSCDRPVTYPATSLVLTGVHWCSLRSGVHSLLTFISRTCAKMQFSSRHVTAEEALTRACSDRFAARSLRAPQPLPAPRTHGYTDMPHQRQNSKCIADIACTWLDYFWSAASLRVFDEVLEIWSTVTVLTAGVQYYRSFDDYWAK